MNNFESNEVQISVGKQIKYIRKKNNLTQANLAHLSGMEESALKRIEAGRTNPTIKTLFKISKTLKIEFKDLFENF